MDVRAYTIAEAAERLGLHYNTVRKLIRVGDIRARRVGRVYRISPFVLARWLECEPEQPETATAAPYADEGHFNERS